MGFWTIVGFTLLSIIGLITLLLIVVSIADSKWFNSAVRFLKAKSLKKKIAKNPDMYKTDAFIAGYKDMAKAVDPGGHEKKIEVFDEKGYDEAMARYRGNPYYSRRVGYVQRRDYVTYEMKETTEVDPKTNMPSYPSADLRAIALNWIEYDTIFDPSLGQTSRKYLTSEDEAEYREYYKGGMKFLEDVDQTKVTIFEERAAVERKDRLYEARKKGLAPMNTQYIESYKALEAMRSETFAPTKSWDEQMSELEAQ